MSAPFANICTWSPTLLDTPTPTGYLAVEQDPLMNLTESAKILGVSFRKLKEIIKAGLLKPDPILGRIRLSVIRNYGK